LKIKQL